MSASRAAAAARLHQVPVPTRLSRLGMSAGLEFEADIDRAIECVLRSRATPFEVRDFSSYGYDERQYCSPGFDLPVGSFRRTPHGEYTEYHTSADNLDFVSEEHLAGSLGALLETIDLLESDVAFRNLSPNCEPQLGRRGLLPAACERAQMALLWMLNLSDGTNSLLDIAERSRLPRRASSHHGNLGRARFAGRMREAASIGPQ